MSLFFKKYKPRGFNYVPRYYDPQKEEREKRKVEVLRKWEAEHYTDGSENEKYQYKESPAERRSKLIRTLIVIGFLIAGVYYLFRSTWLEDILSRFIK